MGRGSTGPSTSDETLPDYAEQDPAGTPFQSLEQDYDDADDDPSQFTTIGKPKQTPQNSEYNLGSAVTQKWGFDHLARRGSSNSSTRAASGDEETRSIGSWIGNPGTPEEGASVIGDDIPILMGRDSAEMEDAMGMVDAPVAEVRLDDVVEQASSPLRRK